MGHTPLTKDSPMLISALPFVANEYFMFVNQDVYTKIVMPIWHIATPV